MVWFALAAFCLKEEKLFEIPLAHVLDTSGQSILYSFSQAICIIFEVLGGINFEGSLRFEEPYFRLLFRKLPLPNELTIVRGEIAAIRGHKQVATLCSTIFKFSLLTKS